MEWRRGTSRFQLETVKIDLLFVADNDVIRRLHDPDTPTPFAEIKRKVRHRDILLYVVRPRDDLLECGYEDFIDSLGSLLWALAANTA